VYKDVLIIIIIIIIIHPGPDVRNSNFENQGGGCLFQQNKNGLRTRLQSFNRILKFQTICFSFPLKNQPFACLINAFVYIAVICKLGQGIN
jgi:hypothetical protein